MALSVCLYTTTDALEKLERLADRVNNHETQITVLEK